MYSQDSIFNRNSRGRASDPSARSAEAASGLACVICGTDYRTAPEADPRVVSHREDAQLLACRGVCARLASGSVTGLDETPLPLAERVRKHQAADGA